MAKKRLDNERRNTGATNQLALLGGKPVGTVHQPVYPYFTKRACQRVMKIMEEGRVLGFSRDVPEVREAEAALSRHHGGRHVLTTSSGHSSLQMALAGLEIADGDEVITTPYSWGASAACILHQNAIPVFADVNRNTGLIDPKQVEAKITSRTRAILPVHMYGHPVDMTAIMRIATRHSLAVVEDCSQAHGTTWKGVGVGNFGHANGFSCMGGKQLGATEAGYMVTPDQDVYWRACLQCQHNARSTEPDFSDALRPYIDSLIYTHRITAVDAALLTEQLKKLPREIDARRQNIATLRLLLADSKYLAWPKHSKHGNPSYYMWSVLFRAKQAGVHRDTFLKALQAEGLAATSYLPAPIPSWPRLHWQTYKGPRTVWHENLRRAKVDYRKDAVPNTEYAINHGIQLIFRFYKPAAKVMQRIADIIYKVESNIDSLRHYEQDPQPYANVKLHTGTAYAPPSLSGVKGRLK
jgi:dTDP-4-amino-4,6-dideoxygalactose transaminase